MSARSLPVAGACFPIPRLDVPFAAAKHVSQGCVRVSAGEAQPRLYLYSGHDTTIMPLLRALDLAVDHWPVRDHLEGKGLCQMSICRRRQHWRCRVRELRLLMSRQPSHALLTHCCRLQGYCANLVFELWEQPGNAAGVARFYVRVLYNGEALRFPGSNEGKLE